MPLKLELLSDKKLEQYLDRRGVAWEVIPASRHAALERTWESIYGDVWRLRLRHKRQDRALGGPYFIEKDLLMPPTRRRASGE